MSDLDSEIKKCVEVLSGGGTILYPTDTVWGIGCDATNEAAVKKILGLKQRPDEKSLIILLDSEARLDSYVREVPEQAWQLIELTEKPLTLVLPGARNLAPNVIAADGSVGIRITKDEFCRRLIARFRKPIVSTSANVSGEKTPSNFSEISQSIRSGVDHVASIRQDETAKQTPSTVIRLGTGGEIKILRK